MNIYQMTTAEDIEKFKILSIEYIDWVFEQLVVNYEVYVEGKAADYVEEDVKSIHKLMPPKGYLFLCDVDGELAGMAGMRELSAEICEVKRMYVRPKFRGQGIARSLFARILEIAKEKKYPKMRLDSGRFMASAHKLYRANGFKEIEPYEGTEVTPELLEYWLYFERHLD